MLKKTAYWNSLMLVAQILSCEKNKNELLEKLGGLTDWNDIVKITSQHLMLPALYAQLEHKELLTQVPKDLIAYLEEITLLNSNRNKIILSELKDISAILKSNKIDFVFIKGTALLIRGLFENHYERMIGDIDILIDPSQCETAFQLLHQNGYKETIGFNYDNPGFRHLPRQINPEKLAAIEIHGYVLNKPHHHLISTDALLSNKHQVDDLSIPADLDNIRISIYSQQITNNAHFLNTINLKNSYDVLAIANCVGEKSLKTLDKDKFIIKWFTLTSALFPELKIFNSKHNNPFYRTLFLVSNTYPKLGFIMFTVKSVYLTVLTRIKLFLFNKSYRKHVISNKLPFIVILVKLFFVLN